MKRMFALTAFLVMEVAPALSQEERVVRVKPEVLLHLVNWHTPGLWRKATALPYLPGSGLDKGYVSLDPVVIDRHNEDARQLGASFLVSWFGKDDPAGDKFLDLYLSRQSAVKIAILYEANRLLKDNEAGLIDFADKGNRRRLRDHLEHLNAKYFQNPAHQDRFVRINDKPFVFIWITGKFTGPFCGASLEARRLAPVYLGGSDFNLEPAFREDLPEILCGLDAESAYTAYHPGLTVRERGQLTSGYVNQYITAARVWRKRLERDVDFILPVSLQFNDTLVRPEAGHPVLEATKEQMLFLVNALRDLAKCALERSYRVLPIFIVASYNEHYEMTGIEPNTQCGYDCFEAVKRLAEPIKVVLDRKVTGCLWDEP